MAYTKSKTRHEWLIPTALVLLSVVPAIGGAARLNDLATNPVTDENARFFSAPLPILIHIPAAFLFSVLGAFQFAPGFRQRHRRWHRTAGKILVPAALLVALSGLWMTLRYAWAPGDGAAVYAERLIFGSAMLAAVVLGIDAIRRRQFNAHGRWMIRAYAIGMGAGTQVLTHLPWFIFAEGRPGGLPRALMMGSAWVINILVAEWIIRRGAQSQSQWVNSTLSWLVGHSKPTSWQTGSTTKKPSRFSTVR
ncbi:MAG: DUF2306 domain-containing protein [Myxococcota bacterium]